MDIYKDITLILVTYRSERLILRNLEVLKQFPVIIVDNSNSDELDLIVHKYNNIKLTKGMILSNEPGFYKKGHFGIRIENLIYVKKFKDKLLFDNFTLAPIEKDLINYKLLNKSEKDYLFRYHLKIYSEYSSSLNKNERRWLASLI